MRIFLDTANIDEIREVARWGILSGVTTNPTLVSKTTGKSHEDVTREIGAIVGRDISVETVSQDTAGMLEEARRFASWHPQVVVKVPATPEGWAAVAQLKDEGIRLLERERTVSELVSLLGSPQGRVSTHLACLRWCGFVVAEKEGRTARYRIVDERVRDLLTVATGMMADNAQAIASCLIVGEPAQEREVE